MAGRSKAYSRPIVLERAMGLFWKRGYEGAHLSELVAVTGLNRHSLYKEFGGKKGLFHEALGEYLTAAEREYQATLDAPPLGLANILRYFRSIRYGTDYHGCLMINTLGQRHAVDDVSFDMALRTARMAERLFRRNLSAAVESGELQPDADVGGLSRTIAALDQGLATYGIVRRTKVVPTSIVAQVERLLGVNTATQDAL